MFLVTFGMMLSARTECKDSLWDGLWDRIGTLSPYLFYVVPLGRIYSPIRKWLEPPKNLALPPKRGVGDCAEIGRVATGGGTMIRRGDQMGGKRSSELSRKHLISYHPISLEEILYYWGF